MIGDNEMPYSYSIRVAVDNDTAEVELEIEADGARAMAKIDPRRARRIAIQLLQSADEMDELKSRKIS
jgi:hypothetical protein